MAGMDGSTSGQCLRAYNFRGNGGSREELADYTWFSRRSSSCRIPGSNWPDQKPARPNWLDHTGPGKQEIRSARFSAEELFLFSTAGTSKGIQPLSRSFEAKGLRRIAAQSLGKIVTDRQL